MEIMEIMGHRMGITYCTHTHIYIYIWAIPSGKRLHSYWSHGPVEIVDLPMKNGDFPVRYFDITRGYGVWSSIPEWQPFHMGHRMDWHSDEPSHGTQTNIIPKNRENLWEYGIRNGNRMGSGIGFDDDPPGIREYNGNSGNRMEKASINGKIVGKRWE